MNWYSLHGQESSSTELPLNILVSQHFGVGFCSSLWVKKIFTRTKKVARFYFRIWLHHGWSNSAIISGQIPGKIILCICLCACVHFLIFYLCCVPLSLGPLVFNRKDSRAFIWPRFSCKPPLSWDHHCSGLLYFWVLFCFVLRVCYCSFKSQFINIQESWRCAKTQDFCSIISLRICP